jgi:hypothetical protein
MKRILFALAGYALYRWFTKPETVEIAGRLPPPRRNAAPSRKAADS